MNHNGLRLFILRTAARYVRVSPLGRRFLRSVAKIGVNSNPNIQPGISGIRGRDYRQASSTLAPKYPTRDQRYSGPELAVLIVDFLPIALAARKSSAQRAQPERARHVCFKSATRTSRRSARRSPDAAWILLEQYFSVHGDSCCCTEGSYRACRMGDDQKQTQVEAFIRDRIDSVLISKPYSCSGTSARRLELSRKWRARFSFRLTLPGKSCTHSAVAACSRGGTAATIFICRRVRRP